MPFQAKNIWLEGRRLAPTDDISDLDTAKMSLMQIVNKKNKIFIIQTKIVWFDEQLVFLNWQRILKMGILEKEVVGDFKREKEIEEGYDNRSTLSVEDRLRLMWREDIYGRLSPELTAVSQCSSMALLMGENDFFYFAVYTTSGAPVMWL